MARSKHHELARKLVSLSLDADRQVSVERVREVLNALEQNPPRQFKALLKEYYIRLRRELRETQAVVEHAGELSDSALNEIAARFTSERGRKITAVSQNNPKLIAGLRIRVGDDVYEDSLATRLHALAHAVQT